MHQRFHFANPSQVQGLDGQPQFVFLPLASGVSAKVGVALTELLGIILYTSTWASARGLASTQAITLRAFSPEHKERHAPNANASIEA